MLDMREKRRNSGVESQESSVDRISSLPDSILAHILSFLPTKDSVATSVLSSQWKFVWRYTRNLHFVHYGDIFRRKTKKNDATYMKFANFVTRILLLHKASYIDNLTFLFFDEKMVYDSVAMDNINNWVATAVARDVKSFILSGIGSRFQFPSCVFTCNSLENLELSNIATLSPSSVVLLPKLKILKLDNVGFECDESVRKLLSGCSSLHTLIISRIKDDNVATFTVRSLTLKHLRIYSTSAHAYDRYSKLEINAPALESMHIYDRLFVEFSVESLPSLLEASITIYPEKKKRFDGHWSSFDNFIAALYNVKVLSLDPAFWLKNVEQSCLSARFLRLTKLTLDHCCGYHSLFEMLDGCNTLETLILKRDYQHSVHQSWTKPKRVFVWVRSRLKALSIGGFCGREDQLAMVNYILQNAGLLGTMSIKASSQMNVNTALRLCQKILNSERKSKKCKIEFS